MRVISPSAKILTSIDSLEILKFIEKVGRTCYKSEDKITNESCYKFVKMIVDSGHESVLEHRGFTVEFTNDRGVSHEEVRHRLASFSQESTRYCNYSKDKFDKNITYIDIQGAKKYDKAMDNLDPKTFDLIYNEWYEACLDAERHYMKMIELGATPQLARSVLNNSTKTTICVTANLREWRTILKQRTSPAAHPQIREVMIPLLEELKSNIPIIFDDINP